MKLFTLTTTLALLAILSACAPYNSAVHSSGFALSPSRADAYFSLGKARDAEQLKFSREQITDARRDGASKGYTGLFKFYDWEYQGTPEYLVLRQLKSGAWQGPNPPSGYRIVKRLRETIYTWRRPLAPQHVALVGNL